MQTISRRSVAGVFALCVLLLGNRAVFADDADAVHVKFPDGDTELDTFKAGTKYCADGDRVIKDFCGELRGLTFARRYLNRSPSVVIDAPAGASIYLLFGGGSDEGACRAAVESLDCTNVGTFSMTDGNALVAYKMVTISPTRIIMVGAGGYGVGVAAKNLSLGDGGSGGTVQKQADESTPATTLHTDPTPDATPIAGPVNRPVAAQATVKALEVYETDAGMMLGQTSEATITLTGSTTPKLTTVRFVTKVGDEMCLARDEALRYIRLKYPNWYISKAEITFEDKYVAHDGGSIGTALGTMILSCIQGFDIDPHAAITGDISANGETRAIGGVSAKIKGAIASRCTMVAIPVDNLDQLTDAVIYNGPTLVTNIQVLGITSLDDAVATIRTDRDPKLTQAIDLFASVQKMVKGKPAALKNKDVEAMLKQVLELDPNHLSAQVMLSIADGTQPKTLSATASRYYTFLSVDNMIGVLKARSDSSATASVPSSVVRTGLVSLRKLRPMADESTRPLIDVWVRFISAWNEMQEGLGSPQSVEEQRQAVLDEMAKEETDPDLMQKMLKEGI